MKPTARLINASRGPIVDDQALISVLKNKQISAISATLAFVVVALWHWYATDWPEENPRVNEQELRTIHPASAIATARLQQAATKVLWMKMLTRGSVWGLILGYGFQGYAFYVCYNWFYFYAVKVRGLDIMHAAAWTSAPFLAMAVLSPVGGWFSDRIARISDRRKGRRAAVWIGMGVAALLLYTGNHLSLTVIALPMIALAAGFTMFAAANFWAACIDLAPGYSASPSARMNTVGSLGGVISSTVTASIAVHQGWSRALDMAVLVTLGSGCSSPWWTQIISWEENADVALLSFRGGLQLPSPTSYFMPPLSPALLPARHG
jgi:nitrate/nitrite transporter NarK